MNLVQLSAELKRLEGLVALALARAVKAAGSPTAKGTNATRTSTSGIIGAAQQISFDAPAYTPLTTGNALLVCNAEVTTSNSGDGVALIPRVGGVNLATVAGNAHAVGGTAGTGSVSAVVAIVKGTPITPGVQAANNTVGHTAAAGSAGLQVTIIELQSS